MNNQTNKELKDYTDQELVNELTKRINNFSLDDNALIRPFLTIGVQYLIWYNAQKEKASNKETK